MDRPAAPASVRWSLVVAIAVVLAVAALVPPGGVVAEPGPFGVVTYDLWLHGSAYFVFQLTVIYALIGGAGRPTTPPVVTPVFTVSYGLFVELLQLTVPYRSFSALDLLANAAGVLVALGCYVLARRFVAGHTRAYT